MYGAPVLANVFHFGHRGVELFFSLSAFVICLIHSRDVGHANKVAIFAFRRFWRVYPLYWAVMLPLIPVLFAVPGMGFGYEREPLVLLQSLTLLPFAPVDKLPVLPVAWTLMYEILFYGAFAVVIAWPRAGWPLIIGWVALFILKEATFPQIDNAPLQFLTKPVVACFLTGLAAFRWRGRLPLGVSVALGTVGTILFAVTGVVQSLTGADIPYSPALFGLYSGAMILALFDLERAGRLSLPRWLIALGGISYTLYLVHWPALSLFQKLFIMAGATAWLNELLAFGLFILGSVLAAIAVHLLLERKLLSSRRGMETRLLGHS